MANYLYNGVELPEFPESVKNEYPYVVIGGYNSGAYCLYCSYTPCTVLSTDAEMTGFSSLDSVDAAYTLASDGTSWGLSYTYDPPHNVSSFGSWDIVWTNYDVLIGGMDVIYRAKSPDPVPVGGEPADPAALQSLLMGWLAGRAVRAQRKEQHNE